MESLNLEHFKSMIDETTVVIESKVDYLNYINIFPVKDSDTGNNLLSTFKYTREKLDEEQNLEEFLKDLKKLLLKGARGNSGVIMSQFYKGLCSHLIKCKTIGAEEFATAINKGCDAAYYSIQDPVDGTMLTVLKGASDGALKVLEKTDSVVDVLLSSFDSAQEQLKKTMNKLPILKEAGVVDSGGLGVVYMLGAWLRATGVVPEYDPFFKDMRLKKEEFNNVDKQYCINVLLEDYEHEKELEEVLHQAGNCVRTVNEENLLRIHLHSDNKNMVRELCSNFGSVKKFETDDMNEQYEKGKD